MFSFATIGRNILLLVLLAIVIFTGIINPRFLSLQNILNILQQISVLGIVSIGMTILLISGGLDLSVGSLISLSAYVGGLTIHRTNSLSLGILALFACAVFF